jgi:hypothetical protein
MKLNSVFRAFLAALAFLTPATLYPQQRSQGDVYAVTRHFSDAGWVYRYWKNGQSVQRFSTDGYSLGERCEVGNDFYEVGAARGGHYIKKNDKTLFRLEDPSDNYVNVKSICLSGGDVYAGGGTQVPDNYTAATIWKNGKILWNLTDGVNDNEANVETVYVSGGDIYAAGFAENPSRIQVATVWKNGKVHQKLAGNNVSSLFVLGNDLFAAGSDENKTVVWKNGKLHQTLNDGSVYASVLSLCVSDGDIYAGGTKDGPEDIGYPTIWKNGKEQYMLGSAGGSVVLVFIKKTGSTPPPLAKADKKFNEPSPGDVYAVTRHGDYYQWEYRYWKNGQSIQPFSTDGYSLGQRCDMGGDVYEVKEDDGIFVVRKNGGIHHSMTKGSREANLLSLSVSGGDVYAGGREYNAKNTWVATIWKNGSVYQRLADGNRPTAVESICVSGGDVYAGGYEYDTQRVAVPTVWKNGKFHQRLTDSGRFACVVSICVSGSNVYAGGAGDGVPTVWKNSEPLYRLGDQEGDVALVFVSDGGLSAANPPSQDTKPTVNVAAPTPVAAPVSDFKLTVTGARSYSEVSKLEKALKAINCVMNVRMNDYSNGVATFDLTASLTAQTLSDNMRGINELRLEVSEATGNAIQIKMR